MQARPSRANGGTFSYTSSAEPREHCKTSPIDAAAGIRQGSGMLANLRAQMRHGSKLRGVFQQHEAVLARKTVSTMGRAQNFNISHRTCNAGTSASLDPQVPEGSHILPCIRTARPISWRGRETLQVPRVVRLPAR